MPQQTTTPPYCNKFRGSSRRDLPKMHSHNSCIHEQRHFSTCGAGAMAAETGAGVGAVYTPYTGVTAGKLCGTAPDAGT